MTKTNVTRRVYTIPFAPVSHNQAYSTRVMRKGKKSYPMRYMQPAYKAFKAKIKEHLVETDAECGGPLPFEPPFALNFLFLLERSSFFFKNGNVRRCDVSDFIKLAEDACSEHWEVDDCHNFLLVAHKRWVDELPEFVEDAYKSPPHKTLRAIIKIVVTTIPESFAEWDGQVVPDTSILH
ncbi:MAG: hypothetical protein ACXABY_18325 [Candidatus Thorarchaeota archaeon]